MISGRTGKKFWKNRLAAIGTVIILLTTFIAVFAVVLSPDKSENANDIKLQIAAKSPGFSISVIELPSVQNISTKWSEWLTGHKVVNEYIPINSFFLDHQHGEVVLLEYSGEETSDTFERRLPYAAFGLNKEIDSVSSWNVIEDKFIRQKIFLLGTDRFGRDMLSRMFTGARISLAVGFIAVAISLFTGTFLGCFAGYYGGRIDHFIMWLINVVWSMPTLLLVIAFTMALGKGFWQIFLAVGLSMWVDVARIVRGQVMGIREKEYIEAARVLGFSDMRIMFRHILPNITGPLTVIAAANFASAILLEAGLSFLGIGVQPPAPSWGMMIKEHFGYIVLDSAYLAIVPGLAIMLLVMAFNFVGNGLRDALDVKMK